MQLRHAAHKAALAAAYLQVNGGAIFKNGGKIYVIFKLGGLFHVFFGQIGAGHNIRAGGKTGV